MYREHTKVVKIGNRVIGGGNPILIQSMTYYKMCSSDTGSCECIERDQKADYDPTGSGYSF